MMMKALLLSRLSCHRKTLALAERVENGRIGVVKLNGNNNK